MKLELTLAIVHLQEDILEETVRKVCVKNVDFLFPY